MQYVHITVWVTHCWLCFSTNHNPVRCHIAYYRPPSVYSVDGSIKGCLMTNDVYTQRHTIVRESAALSMSLVTACQWRTL